MNAVPAGVVRVPWDSLVIWGLPALAVFGLRDVFFIAFLTFLLSYLIRSIVVALAGRLCPGAERPGLKRWLTLATCVVLVALCGSRRRDWWPLSARPISPGGTMT